MFELIGWTFFTIDINWVRKLFDNNLIRLKSDVIKQNFMNFYKRKINSVIKVNKTVKKNF